MEKPTETLLKQLQTLVVDEKPNLVLLKQKIADELSLSVSDANDVLRYIVAELNSIYLTPITYLEIIHTEACNLACRYCFETAMHSPAKIPESILKKSIDLLFAYSLNEPKLGITHFGGEPLLNLSSVILATDYARQLAEQHGKSICFNMTSNCTILNERIAEDLAKRSIKVLVSIDGLAKSNDLFRIDKKSRGTFDRVIAGLKILKAVQPWVGAKMTIMPENAHRLFDDVIGLHELGVNQFLIGHATGIGWPDEAFSAFADSLRNLAQWYAVRRDDTLRIDYFDDPTSERIFGCQAGRNSIAVSVTGEISGCSKILALDTRRLVAKLGDVESGLTNIRNRLDMVDCRRLKAACDLKGPSRKYIGSCFATNHSSNGNIYEPDEEEQRFQELRNSICLPEMHMC